MSSLKGDLHTARAEATAMRAHGEKLQSDLKMRGEEAHSLQVRFLLPLLLLPLF